MTDSILTSTKKILGIAEEDTAFDLDIMTHINTMFLTLDQIGVGPAGGFMIEDAEVEWWDLLGDDPRLNAVKTLIYLQIRMIFDPAPNSFTQSAQQKQIEELTWRLQVHAESVVVPTGI